MREDVRKRLEQFKEEVRQAEQKKLDRGQGPKQPKKPTEKSLYENRPHFIPSIAAAVMLFGALGQWPYGYYQLLRWVVCGVAIYVAVSAYNWKKVWAAWLFGFVAVLFNPLIPVHLSRDAWQPIDMVCSILFIFAAAVLREPSQNTSDPA